jgi:hypothetical protein
MVNRLSKPIRSGRNRPDGDQSRQCGRWHRCIQDMTERRGLLTGARTIPLLRRCSHPWSARSVARSHSWLPGRAAPNRLPAHPAVPGMSPPDGPGSAAVRGRGVG